MFDALADCLIYCRVERRLADPTCKAYARDTRACLEHLSDHGITGLVDVRTSDLRRFLAQEATHRPSPSSQARTTAALRCFFRFCVENEYLERDPAAVLRSPKQRETLPDIINHTELGQLLVVPGREGVWKRVHPGKRERDCLLLALFAYGGLRHSELLGLDWDDVDLERRLVRVRHAKGGRQRTVPIHPGLIPLFLAYHATRTPLQDPAVFVGVLGIVSPPRSSPGHSVTTPPPQASTSTSASRLTRCATCSPPNSSALAPTYARSRSCSDISTSTSTSTPPSATPA